MTLFRYVTTFLGALSPCMNAAHGQYHDKPVRLVVSYAAGNVADAHE